MTASLQKIRIGTRGSPLALTQTNMVRTALSVVAPDIDIETVIIKTSGDWRPEQGEVRLSTEAGGKGQFAKEIEEALLAEAVDCAVHSMKDMETRLPRGLTIPVMLPREDARDALLLSDPLREVLAGKQAWADTDTEMKADLSGGALDILPEGATVGTASVRRQAFLLAKRPDLNVVPLRGNVQTRIEKVRAGQVDATFLAVAGLNRLNLTHEIDLVLDVEDFLPAAGQGAVGVEVLYNNKSSLAFISQLNCPATLLCVSAERAALSVLDGSCHTPIGAYATLDGDDMFLRISVAALDGSEVYCAEVNESVRDVEYAVKTGASLAEKLKADIPQHLLQQSAQS